MGCKFSKNKVVPVVEPTCVKPATSPPTSPKLKAKAKKKLAKGTSGKKTPPPVKCTRDAPPSAVTNDAASPTGYLSPQAEPLKAMESLKQHPTAGKEQSVVDHAPIRLVKEADVCNQEVTPFTARETPGTLVIKRCSQGSIKTDPMLSAGSRDSGISLAAGESDGYSHVITEKSSVEKQEIAKVVQLCLQMSLRNIFKLQVPNTSTPDLTIQGVNIQSPFKPSQAAKLGITTKRRPSSALPPLPHCLQRPPPPLQAEEEDEKLNKLKLLSIVERPSSRGGMAFDINFGDNNGGTKKMPKTLQEKMKTNSLTKEELQAKMDAAEQRRKVQKLCHSS